MSPPRLCQTCAGFELKPGTSGVYYSWCEHCQRVGWVAYIARPVPFWVFR